MNSNHRMGIRAMAALPIYFLISLLAFTSCSEKEDTTDEYPDWQNTNATYWDNLYTQTLSRISSGDASWKMLRSFSLEDTLQVERTSYIIVNVLREGTGSGCPLYTDSVRVRYTGRLLPSTSYPNGYVFQTTSPDGTTEQTAGVADLPVNGLIDGFSTALQHMHIGDVWDVYIPWTLGYGVNASANNTIPAYSVLRFNISLVAYAHAGSSLPKFRIKPQRP